MHLASTVRKLYHTLRHLKAAQIFYQLKYRLKRPRFLKSFSRDDIELEPLSFFSIPPSRESVEILDEGFKVIFLNKTKIYQNSIQWDDMTYGRLWNYHLQYADFLKQHNLSVDMRAKLVLDLYRWLMEGNLQPEPYPSSLRIMNAIRFLSENHAEITIGSEELKEYLYSELKYLVNHLEFHLMGNHLMENAFALLMGGFAFDEREWIRTAEKILEDQINEQILEDGAHFERSPMYHLIMLYRFLEAIYYLPSGSKLSSLFFKTSNKMLGWIERMSFKKNGLAHFNDSTDGQSYSKNEIVKMANKCGLTNIPHINLSQSGFRKFSNKNFELLIDALGIAPSYQPAHSHADSLSFILHINGQAVMTDPGVSTYELGERRIWERSTKAHNTVTYNEQNTADLWSRFRIGRRPNVNIRKEKSSQLEISLNHKLLSGEHFFHQRNFKITDEFIEIMDAVNLKKPVEGRLYLHPDIKINKLNKLRAELTNGVIILFHNVNNIEEFTYDYCLGFNLYKKSPALEYTFSKRSTLKIAAPQI